ncbi:hypothetical protein PRO82_000546 [Candidatus Protochlamydia amoebophila]|uniref:hypothetical protein n=1 Tax=Candidatus Protochlamydia amoebophila TaxID=362787 RepID=UPI001BC96E2D|nr:hypothetical protein [Candidatus Protochlamydia amoebophila]MBS4163246.1 hypothetical protein [Candidatus Protochlamydia amoebophila]
MMTDLCVNFVSSTIELYKDLQVDERGRPSCPVSEINVATQKYFDKLGSPPSSLSKMKFLDDMTIQLPCYLSFSLYKFYFYQCKEISDPKDFIALSIQIDKAKHIAAKAIKEYQECMKLVDAGIYREVFNFFPSWMLDCFYGRNFVKLTTIIKADSLPLPDDYAVYLLNQLPETMLENFRLISEKVRSITLPHDSWTIVEVEKHKYTAISAEIFIKIHHRAIEDIPHLFYQEDGNDSDKNLVDKYFRECKFFQMQQKRVEEHEQHNSL